LTIYTGSRSARRATRAQRNGIQVIARAAAVLRALEGKREGLSLGEIAATVGLPRSTVQRIVYALAHEGLVMAASPGQRVRLGSALLRLASGAQLEIVQHARPWIEALSQTLNETVDLAVLVGNEVVFVDHVVARRRLRLVSDIGVHFPLHCTANGKAILAALEPGTASALLGRRLKAHTRHTITGFARLRRELAAIRESGVAYDREEHTDGICAVGMAIHTRSDGWAAVSVPMPASRFYGREARLARAVSACCRKIEAAFSAN
jgi:DNA-binding IclR family transcriptional regulator